MAKLSGAISFGVDVWGKCTRSSINIQQHLTLFGLGFCQPKKTWGGGEQNGRPPNLAISSQMKRGKGILWVEIFTN